jgi:hypothetical protein
MLTALQLRRLRCWDGLHYSFQMLDLCQSSLWESCCRIPEDNENAIRALSYCWLFIDSLHRIRELAQAIPGLSTKKIEMRRLLNGTAAAEKYRHYIQHLRSEVNADPPNGFPVWGSLSWVSKDDSTTSYIAVLGAQLPGVSFSSCVLDTQTRKWVSRVSLSIYNLSFNFDPIYECAKEFEKFILPYLLKDLPPEVKMHERLPIMSARFANASHNSALQRAGDK